MEEESTKQRTVDLPHGLVRSRILIVVNLKEIKNESNISTSVSYRRSLRSDLWMDRKYSPHCPYNKRSNHRYVHTSLCRYYYRAAWRSLGSVLLMKQFLKDLFAPATGQKRKLDSLIDTIKAQANSVEKHRYDDYLVPARAAVWTTTTSSPRPFYRAARPAKRWK